MFPMYVDINQSSPYSLSLEKLVKDDDRRFVFVKRVIIQDDELISLQVETFDGKLYELQTIGYTIKNKHAFHVFCSKQGIAYKSISSFDVLTCEGHRVSYYRNYRGQEFRRDDNQPG